MTVIQYGCRVCVMSAILPVIVYGNNPTLFSAVLNVLLVSACPPSTSQSYPLAGRLSVSKAWNPFFFWSGV